MIAWVALWQGGVLLEDELRALGQSRVAPAVDVDILAADVANVKSGANGGRSGGVLLHDLRGRLRRSLGRL